jgi:hypothetical protein
MRRILFVGFAAILLIGVVPAAAAPATKADCDALATGLDAYAAVTDGFAKSAASLMLTPDEDRFPADVRQSMKTLAASRDAMLPTMEAFLKSLQDSTALLRECGEENDNAGNP